MTGYVVSGLVTRPLLAYFLWSLPAIVPAILLGRWLNGRMKDARFFRYSYVLLLLVGVVVIADARL